jgi:hypothetical protein
MKNLRIILGILVVLIIKGCSEDSPTPNDAINEVTGTYIGTLRSSTLSEESAQGEISLSDDDQIIFHCYSNSFDSTMVLKVFEDHDTINICTTGEAFESEYGHVMGHGHLMHGNNITGTSWEHHLADEHVDSDKHHGFYKKKDHMFYYTFHMSENNIQYKLEFQGTKQ